VRNLQPVDVVVEDAHDVAGLLAVEKAHPQALDRVEGVDADGVLDALGQQVPAVLARDREAHVGHFQRHQQRRGEREYPHGLGRNDARRQERQVVGLAVEHRVEGDPDDEHVRRREHLGQPRPQNPDDDEEGRSPGRLGDQSVERPAVDRRVGDVVRGVAVCGGICRRSVAVSRRVVVARFAHRTTSSPSLTLSRNESERASVPPTWTRQRSA